MKIRNLLSIKKLAVLGICVSFLAGGCGKMTESKGFSLFPEKQFHIVFNGIDSGDAEVFNEKSCNIWA